ncbi:MAG TPA: arylamine N-acetyltransferase [Ktedonobacterales bacterium]
MSTRVTASTSDVQDYLDRIGFATGADFDALEPSLGLLRALHEAHLLAVPFENLSIHYGQPIVLEEAALYDKIVHRHRGGFCYELNGLFAWLLHRLGFEVSLLSAGVARGDGSFNPDFDHLTLRVHHLEGTDWLADVGFGDAFRRPLLLQRDGPQDGGDGHLYRLRQDQDEGDGQQAGDEATHAYWVLEQYAEVRWSPQYRFTLQPRALADFTARCEYQQTSPESHFTRQRICSLALPCGRVSLSDRRLITTIDGQREERVLQSEAEYRAVLAERFGVVV